MPRLRALLSLLLLAGLAASLPAQTDTAKVVPVGVRVVIQTEFGDIEAVIDTVHSPVTGKNFLRYVDAGLYTGSRFHRAVTLASQPDTVAKIEVIQGSLDPSKSREAFPSIPLERTSVTGLKHLDGTLSMARSSDPNSASSQYFICIGAQPALDFGGKRNADGQGFAAFGQVVSGMDIVRKIQSQPANARESLTPPIGVKNIVRKP